MPKDEPWDCDVPSETTYSRHAEENVASSSGSNIRSSFIGMGFSEALVDKVIGEKGEDNSELLLETLFAYSALREPNSESSYSFSELSGEIKDDNNSPAFEAESHVKREPDIYNECNDDKRSSLLMMNFSVDEVEFAMDKLGRDASVADMVDFIVAAQIAGNPEKDKSHPTQVHGVKNEDDNTKASSGTMGKTLRLLEMGFSDKDISLAIEKFGSELPLSELADSIFAGQVFDACAEEEKYSVYAGTDHGSLGMGVGAGSKHSSDMYRVKSEDYSLGDVSEFGMEKNRKGKRLKRENMDNSSIFLGPTSLKDIKPDPSRYWTTAKRDLHRVGEALNKFGMSNMSKNNPFSSSVTSVAKPPYFFYGNVVDISQSTWTKMSHFLYGIKPEFVNTQLYSALNRKEGYIHNLPTENRFHIFPKAPMTIEAAIRHTKKWWPSWDPRKQLNCISSETTGISQLCGRLERILTDSRGLVSVEQQKDILHHCWKWNLLWVGQYKLAPTEPEHLESILGYPQHHSLDAGVSLTERLHFLKHCLQTDTLGYHLSVLKPMFPAGLRVLSLCSGIGGAEVALHRLDIHLRSVVSVETSDAKRRILQKWWHNTAQTGELVQIDDIQKLGNTKLESLVGRFGGFDLIICQTPSNLSSKSPKTVADGDSFAGFDFSMFCEFVRVLQGARSIMERKK